MVSLTDQQAIAKIKGGEINYFSIIVKNYEKKIYNYVCAKLFDKDDADDLVQNIFLRFYKAIARFDEKKPVFPYLYSIAINELKMYYRSRKEKVSLDEKIYFENEQEELMIEDYLEKIPKEKRVYLELLSQGYSYKEIAEKFNKSINTIKTIVRRTRLELKQL